MSLALMPPPALLGQKGPAPLDPAEPMATAFATLLSLVDGEPQGEAEAVAPQLGVAGEPDGQPPPPAMNEAATQGEPAEVAVSGLLVPLLVSADLRTDVVPAVDAAASAGRPAPVPTSDAAGRCQAVTLHLTPAEIGELEVEIRLQGTTVHVTCRCAAEVLPALRHHDLAPLLLALEQRGLTLAPVRVLATDGKAKAKDRERKHGPTRQERPWTSRR